MGRVIVTKTISMPLEVALLVQKLAEKLQMSESAAVREAILEKAEKLGLIEDEIK
ncbi:ribbon-helix-helix protein, CopG family [Archaeoglobus veneficus]|uniref:CopG-like domain-containing protein DNA-binding protein n=1 Tax=Archaeoglobus veneficus (strain DSM 11195 / SNP6) TaxID=693661 RepID=F2KRH7_ARCVS|nr:ribbon-helix-helix protein, CopG family [Archaeoglobus veneficus]AEA46742.1 CopG-like domain-containing protein DNA-binding protein [Archaeoglobus veneficus SNP6]